MDFSTGIMTEHDAAEIVQWRYDAPYDFYNMEDTEASRDELMNGAYRSVRTSDGELFGFYCIGQSAQVPAGYRVHAYDFVQSDVVDFGLGMRPDCTGHGLGTPFFRFVLASIEKRFGESDIRLTVAQFNQRAIRLYQKFGFLAQTQFDAFGTIFQTMVRPKASIHQ